MVLIKVVKLVIDIDWLRNVTVNVNLQSAVMRDRRCIFITALVILLDNALDLLTHDIESDAECQENQAKNSKDNHC